MASLGRARDDSRIGRGLLPGFVLIEMKDFDMPSRALVGTSGFLSHGLALGLAE